MIAPVVNKRIMNLASKLFRKKGNTEELPLFIWLGRWLVQEVILGSWIPLTYMVTLQASVYSINIVGVFWSGD